MNTCVNDISLRNLNSSHINSRQSSFEWFLQIDHYCSLTWRKLTPYYESYFYRDNRLFTRASYFEASWWNRPEVWFTLNLVYYFALFLATVQLTVYWKDPRFHTSLRHCRVVTCKLVRVVKVRKFTQFNICATISAKDHHRVIFQQSQRMEHCSFSRKKLKFENNLLKPNHRACIEPFLFIRIKTKNARLLSWGKQQLARHSERNAPAKQVEHCVDWDHGKITQRNR